MCPFTHATHGNVPAIAATSRTTPQAAGARKCFYRLQTTMKPSGIMKRSIVVAGHRTSISLEDTFWRCLRDIATANEMTLSKLVASIDKDRQQGNLSSHIRCFVLEYYQTKATAEQTISSVTATAPT
jgi:predicted DNA-binding ribbon-helix-helix protein